MILSVRASKTDSPRHVYDMSRLNAAGYLGVMSLRVLTNCQRRNIRKRVFPFLPLNLYELFLLNGGSYEGVRIQKKTKRQSSGVTPLVTTFAIDKC